MLDSKGYQSLLEDVKTEFPDFKIVKKEDSFLMKAINAFLSAITFGKMNSFMKSFITTIGNTMYVPSEWDLKSPSTKAITVRHERIHMRQSRDVGRIKFSLLYLLFPFPTVVAYYRMKFEQEAYEESLKALFEYYGSKFLTQATKDNIVNHFTSAEYFWMWPWKAGVEKWYDKAVSKIKLGEK